MRNITITRRLSVLIALFTAFCCQLSAYNFENFGKYNFITVPYVSVDAENNPVVLSVSISYPTVQAPKVDPTPVPVKFIVLSNHPTITKNSQAPSGTEPLDGIKMDGGINVAEHGAMAMVMADSAMVISCDYLGWGYSRDHVHPYCNHTLTARNVLDGFVAALDTAKARGITIADDYYTYNLGYSQGGSVSMAVQKYLETEASEDVVNLVRLKKTICGAGPYDLELTYKDLAARKSLAYACSLCMTIEGLYAAYKEGCMKQIDLDSIYISHDFRVAIEEVLNSKEITSEEVDKWINNYFGKDSVNIKDLIRPEILDHSSATAHALDKALSKCNMLNGEWIPKTPITLYQFTQDDVVPFANSEKAVEIFGDKVKLYTEKDDLKCNDSVLEMLLHAAMPNPTCHLDYGICFFAYIIDGVLRDK